MKSKEAAALAADLSGVLGEDVLFGAGDRALYATDASNYRQVPIGVIRPRNADEAVEAMRICREHGAPVLARGGGTSLAGQCCNVAVVFDFSRHMNRVLDIDPDARTARVEGGVVLDDLRAATGRHGLTFGPDPATHNRCTLGGMIGNNSCGVHSVLAEFRGPGPRTEHNVAAIDVVTYDGERMQVGPTPPAALDAILRRGGRRAEIYRRLLELRSRYEDVIRTRFPDIPRRVSGYNLPALLDENGFDVARALVGTEGTCALTLQATVHLIDAPGGRALLVLGYPDVFAAADDVPAIMAHRPIGLEGMDQRLVDDMRRAGLHAGDLPMLPDGHGWLLVEFGGENADDAHGQAEALVNELRSRAAPPSTYLSPSADEAAKIWEIRESGLGATAYVPGRPPTWEGWEDAAVPPDRLGSYLREFRALMDRFEYSGALYGHFGQGCIHTRIDFELSTRPGVDRFANFIEEAADLVVRHGGSLSGEHGDGIARAGLLGRMFGEEGVRAFGEFKAIWDPGGRMNPGRVVDPWPVDANLRFGPDYAPRDPPTKLAFPEDDHSFAHAAARCVGVGKCRRTDGGTMCPSYMVTFEERHSTRGRARLLHEMLRGEVIEDGWRSDEVHDALDLCLSCKGCKGDCPVDVDMAAYKAEFLSHYYAGRLRPRAAYAMGLIDWWARIASLAPRAVNAITHAPLLGRAIRFAGGVSQQRAMPHFAPETFRSWWRRRGRDGRNGGRQVLFWPDTFNDHFHPEIARAAVRVLERSGFDVRLPDRALCCGRPLYDFGMLDLAKRKLARIVRTLRDDIRAGVPVVGIEPSCIATFRDELARQFPHDEDARRLRENTFLLPEFLAEHAEDREAGRLHGRALVHIHCHQGAVLRPEATLRTLEAIGLEPQQLDSGCCGMAGSFGFEDGHYEVSQACAERVLLPALRNAPADTWIVADGFSCREMLSQNGIARALHTAQLLDMALARTARRASARRAVRQESRRGAPGWRRAQKGARSGPAVS